MEPIYRAIVYLLWFLTTYYVVFFILVLFTKKKDLYIKKRFSKTDLRPKVSIIVPAYNEENNIKQTIQSLKKINYPNYEVIILNDGSKDNTSSIIKKNIIGDSKFSFIDNTENKGKAGVLNQGILKAKGEYIACMDADSIVEREIFNKALPHFNENVGAVTVSIELMNPNSFLNKIIEIEYIIGLSLFLKIFSFFDCVFVTPGPFSIFRTDLVKKIGGFDEENITEDLEIAYRIHRSGFKIINCIEARAKTIPPATFKETYVQRKRWYGGAIQTLVKHKDVFFNKKYGAFGFFIPFNYLLIFSGLSIFIITTIKSFIRFFREMSYFQYTGFNIWDHILNYQFDILRTKTATILGLSAFSAGIAIMIIGLIVTNKKFSERKLGMLGFPFLFFLYQIFWIGAVLTLIRGKKLKWK